MERVKVQSLGPIADAKIRLGDLTLLVGPQASGKSILLQLIKLLIDKKHIRKTLEQYGFIWGENETAVLDRYFGEGMSSIWTTATKIELDDVVYPKCDLLFKRGERIRTAAEQLFYIPAQRVVCLQNGWPRFFTDYEDAVPYVLRHFSETLRQQLESDPELKNDIIFPRQQQLKSPLRDSFTKSIFHDGKIVLDKSGKKRFKLNIADSSIPYMAWSAGQKEFMPLLMSFYWLCPPSKASRKDDISYVVVEEPEMGLHPQAIVSVILQIIDLLSRGYKVILSTHSPVFLEFAWAIRFLKQSGADDTILLKLFGLKSSAASRQLFDGFLQNKNIFTYSFDRKDDGIHVKDISTLDAGSDDSSIAEWGGLSSFSSIASDIVANAVSHES